LRQAKEIPDAKDPEPLLGLIVGTMALRHLIPAGPEDLGRLTGHPQEKSALFSPGKEASCRRSGLPEPAQSRTERETQEKGGPTEGGKGGRMASAEIARAAESTGPD